MTATTFYDLLGVSKSDDLTADVLRKAYYKKALLVHPDKDPSPEAVARFQVGLVRTYRLGFAYVDGSAGAFEGIRST